MGARTLTPEPFNAGPGTLKYHWQVARQRGTSGCCGSWAMHHYSADALVLRSYRYGEADRIVVFLTEDRGKKRGVAKNATRSRRRFGAALEPLTRGRATYVEREHRELVLLDRVEGARTTLAASAGRLPGDGAEVLGHASYFAELIDEWAPDGAPNERLFRLGAAVGEALGQPGSVDALARYFEYWLLRLEGVYPAVDRCARCGVGPFTDGAVLVAAERAYLCGTCAAGGRVVPAQAFTFLRSAGRWTPGEAARADVSRAAMSALEDAHHRLIRAHLEKELRSTRVVKELKRDP
jgi:DNA repair protein RecO (recombination protein O)